MACFKIDRVCVNDMSTSDFKALSKFLQRTIYDCSPICLDSDWIKWGPCPFRFEDKWFKVNGLH